MVDSKSKKTFNKLGKLFGVQALPTDGEVSGGEELGGPPVTGVKPGILGVLDGKTSSNEDFLESQENDVVTPLPNDSFSSPRSMTPQNVSPKIGANGGLSTSVSPEQLPSTGLGSTGLVHPLPNKPYDVNRQSPVSRTSSTKKSSSSVAKSAPVSRSSSVNKRPPLKETATSMKPRFRMLEDGNHEHSLKSARRQEKLSNMLKDLLGAKKLRSEAKSAVPNILGQQPQAQQPPQANGQEPPTLFAGFVNQYENDSSPYHGPALAPPDQQDCRSFVEKYGRCLEVIGRGSFGTVRISHKKLEGPEEILYAVKEFKKRPNESEKKYNRRLTSEFCISSSLKNINIIDTLDLLKDAKGDYCEVMEFCSGGDLYTLIITAGKLEYAEADCFFKQLIRGVNYMHELGVSHRDLKPENLLLTQSGVVKITDFGNSECFKMAWEDSVHLSEGICGSSPYIAPEEYSQRAFDPRGVDIWSCGVIYMAMRTGRQLWKLADPTKDEFFREYLVKRKDTTGYDPIESLKRARCRNVIYSILDPKPERRINGKQILNSEWGREIKVCDAAEHSIAKSGHIAY